MLKKIFQKKTPAYDKEALWSQIEEKLNKKKRRRFFLLWFIGVSSLSICLWQGLHSTLENRKNNWTNEKNINDSKTKENIAIITHQKEQKAKTNESFSQNINHDDKKSIDLKPELITPHTMSQSNHHTTKLNNTNKTKLEIKDAHFNENNEQITLQTKELGTMNAEGSNSNLNLYQGTKIETLKALSDAPKFDKVEMVISPLNPITPKFWMNHEQILKTPELNNIMNQKQRSFWSMSLLSGYQNTKRNVVNKGTNDVYYKFKLVSERPAENIFGMVLLKYNTRQFTFGTGLHYQRITEWFKGVDVITESTFIESDSASYYNTPSGLVYEPGMLIKNKITRRTVNSPNYLTRINIPIEIGFHFLLSKELAINGKLGFDWNIFSSRSGINIDEDLTFFYHDASKFKSIYKTNSVNSYYGGIMISKQISKSWSVDLGCSFQRDLTSIYKNQLDSRYRFWGIEMGLSYGL